MSVYPGYQDKIFYLSNPNVDGLIVSMNSRELIDEYLGASGSGALRSSDRRLLDRYLALNGETQCRQGCGECLTSCPFGVEIDDVLRARMYAEDYGNVAQGRAAHAGLAVGASPCIACTSLACAGACPSGLDIPALTRSAAERFGRS